MFFSGSKSKREPISSDAILRNAVQEALGTADSVTVDVVTAVAGLLAAVAYADREIAKEEEAHLRQELDRIAGLSKDRIEAVFQILTQHALRLNTTFVPRFTRTLREELPVEQRVEVLDALLGMAAADGVITHDEVVSLRNLSTALGLSQAHYNELQTKYRDKLA